MKRAAIIAAALALSGCAHVTHQLVVHAPEIAAWGAAAYAGTQAFQFVNAADDTAHRLERRVEQPEAQKAQ